MWYSLSIPKRFVITYLLYCCFALFSTRPLSPTVTFDYLLRCPYLSCDIWIVASNIYLLYLHFNKSRVRARILFQQSVWEQAGHSIDKSNTKMFAINHMILGEKVLFSSFQNFIPFGYTLSVVLSFTFFSLVCIFFFFCLFDLLLYTILLVPLCTLSSSYSLSAPSKKYSFEIRLSILRAITKEIEQQKNTMKVQKDSRERELVSERKVNARVRVFTRGSGRKR